MLRKRDWDEPLDYFKLVRFIRYGHKRDPVYVLAGQMWGTSIGHGTLVNRYANSLNLDQFEINLTPDSGSVAELTVGQQLGQNLYVKVQQGIGDNSQTNFVLEYEFNKWMRLQTNVLEGSAPQQQLFQRVKSTGADLVFTFQFK